MLRRRFVLAGSSVALAAALTGAPFPLAPAGAADARSEAVADRALTFFDAQQRADGGFGEGGRERDRRAGEDEATTKHLWVPPRAPFHEGRIV